MAKNKNKAIRVSEGSEDQPADNFQWETLKDLMQETVGAMVSQQELIRALMDKAKDIFISNNKESEYQALMIPVLGFFNSYKDIADKLRKNSELHITYNDDNTIIDYKKGEVSEENDETACQLENVEELLIPRIIDAQSVGVDSITGATATSNAVKTAVLDVLFWQVLQGIAGTMLFRFRDLALLPLW